MSKPKMAGRLAHAFIHSKLTPLILVASISLGVAAVFMLPREEEPQIIVPMIDVMVSFPGASAKEVETRIAKPMERLLWEIPGVEYIYTTSSPGSCMAIVRFYVGEDEEKSIVRLNQKMFSNFDLIPPGASQPLIKPRSIDDVPFLALTLWSNELDGYQIRRAAAELRNELQQVPDISTTQLIGGQRRTMLVEPDPARLAAYGISTSRLQNALQMENREAQAGMMTQNNKAFSVHLDGFFRNADEVGALVVAVQNNVPVYLRDVAKITDGPEEPADYVFFSPGRRCENKGHSNSAEKQPARLGPGIRRENRQRHHAGRHDHVRQTQRQECSRTIRGCAGKSRAFSRTQLPCLSSDDRHTQLRRNRIGKIERASAPHDDRRPIRHDPDLADPGIQGSRSGRGCDPRDSGADACRLSPVRLYAEPHHSVCPHFFHRDPGRRCHRRH